MSWSWTTPFNLLGAVLYKLTTLILYPILWLLEHILALLILVLAPFWHILQYLLHAISIPFAFLATRFETLYIFFGTATLLGLLTGVILYGALNFIGPIFGTERRSRAKEEPRTAASYRAERVAREARRARERTALGFGTGKDLRGEDVGWLSASSHGHGQGAPTSMMGTMIMEEASSSE